MKPIIILIPPSEGKVNGGEFESVKLSSISKLLLKDLEKYKGSLEKLYGVKGNVLEKTKNINSEIRESKTFPAILRYSGVVYKSIDYNSVKNKELFDKIVYILSGLFGLINAKELIPNYKFKINFFGADKLWKPIISKFLEDYYVIDLLPQAHKKAINYEEGISVEFIILKNGKKIPAGHNGKFVKGKFVRWLIENDVNSVSRFAEFNEECYKWNGEKFLKRL